MHKRMLAVVLLPGLLGWSGVSVQDNPPSDELTVGIRHFDEGDLEAAVTSLSATVRRLEGDSTRSRDLARGYLYLAMARLGLGEAEAARRAMGQALRADPALRLDPTLYPPRVMQLYESVRATSVPVPTTPAATTSPAPPAPATSTSTLGLEHRKIDCFVAGKYPRLDACFSPVAEVAGARLYFRPGTAGQWYYVEMKVEGACHAGVLPRPQRSLAGGNVEYYIEATGRRFATARTPEYSANVVGAPVECKSDMVAAAATVSGTVAVFPSLPAGFAVGGGGLGTVGVVGIVGGGVAVAGVAVAAAGGGGDVHDATADNAIRTHDRGRPTRPAAHSCAFAFHAGVGTAAGDVHRAAARRPGAVDRPFHDVRDRRYGVL